jgi:hypothetical protein
MNDVRRRLSTVRPEWMPEPVFQFEIFPIDLQRLMIRSTVICGDFYVLQSQQAHYVSPISWDGNSAIAARFK